MTKKKQLPFDEIAMKESRTLNKKHMWKVRKHRATHENKRQQERMRIVIRMIRCVN